MSQNHSQDDQPGAFERLYRRIRPFRPLSKLTGGHLQTILPALLRRPPEHDGERHRLELDDGDFLDVDLFLPPEPPQAFCIIVHGLEGSSESVYVQGTVDAARRRNFVAVAMNLRGCSGEDNRKPYSYHAASTGDLLEVVRWTSERWPELPGGIVAFSLGANQTLHLLARHDDELPAQLRAVVAVSSPFNLFRVADVLDAPTPTALLYRFNFLRSLIPKALRKAERFPDHPEVEVVRKIRKLQQFDQQLTAPLHGFESAHEYYRLASSSRCLPAVKRPLLVLSAKDDPIIPGDSIPRAAIRANPFIHLKLTRSGGHVGFLGGSLRQPHFWAEQQAILWLRRQLGLHRA